MMVVKPIMDSDDDHDDDDDDDDDDDVDCALACWVVLVLSCQHPFLKSAHSCGML